MGNTFLNLGEKSHNETKTMCLTTKATVNIQLLNNGETQDLSDVAKHVTVIDQSIGAARHNVRKIETFMLGEVPANGPISHIKVVIIANQTHFTQYSQLLVEVSKIHLMDILKLKRSFPKAS